MEFSTDSYFGFRSTFLLIGKHCSGSGQKPKEETIGSFCRHTRKSPHINASLGPLFTKKTPSYGYRDSHYKPERSDDRLRFIMGIPILIRRHLLSKYGDAGGDRRMATRQQMGWSNCAGLSGTSWHSRVFSMSSASDVHIELHWKTGVKVESCKSTQFLFWNSFRSEDAISLIFVCMRPICESTLSCTLMHSQNSQLGISAWTKSTLPGGHRCMCMRGQSLWPSSLGFIGVP